MTREHWSEKRLLWIEVAVGLAAIVGPGVVSGGAFQAYGYSNGPLNVHPEVFWLVRAFRMPSLEELLYVLPVLFIALTGSIPSNHFGFVRFQPVKDVPLGAATFAGVWLLYWLSLRSATPLGYSFLSLPGVMFHWHLGVIGSVVGALLAILFFQGFLQTRLEQLVENKWTAALGASLAASLPNMFWGFPEFRVSFLVQLVVAVGFAVRPSLLPIFGGYASFLLCLVFTHIQKAPVAGQFPTGSPL
jgi:hypothetical protein